MKHNNPTIYVVEKKHELHLIWRVIIPRILVFLAILFKYRFKVKRSKTSNSIYIDIWRPENKQEWGYKIRFSDHKA